MQSTLLGISFSMRALYRYQLKDRLSRYRFALLTVRGEDADTGMSAFNKYQDLGEKSSIARPHIFARGLAI